MCGDDCDDLQPSVSPDGAEICNGMDDDCSGAPDDGIADIVKQAFEKGLPG